MSQMQEIAAGAYPYHREIGERTLDLIASPSSSETPLEVSCRREAIGSLVELVVSSGLGEMLQEISVEEMTADEIMACVQTKYPTYVMHRGIRDDLVRVCRALTAEGLWHQLPEVVSGAKVAEAAFAIERDRELARIGASMSRVPVVFPQPSAKSSPLGDSSLEVLEGVSKWLKEDAIPIVESGRGIPQRMNREPASRFVNDELRALQGMPLSEKIAGAHRILERVQSNIDIALLLRPAAPVEGS